MARRSSFQVWLSEVDGARHRWTVQFRPLPGNKFDGECDFTKRTITIDSRLRNFLKICLTLIHEVTHVAGGEVLSEEVVETIEANITDALKALFKQ